VTSCEAEKEPGWKDYGFYSVMRKSALGRMGDDLKLEFADSKAAEWVVKIMDLEQKYVDKVKVVKERQTPHDEEAVAAEVAQWIASSPVFMFSFKACPWCVKAKQLLNDAGIDFDSIEVDDLGEKGPWVQNALAQMTGRTSMPNVFINGTCIGGCTDGIPTGYPGVKAMTESGDLQKMLGAQQAPVESTAE